MSIEPMRPARRSPACAAAAILLASLLATAAAAQDAAAPEGDQAPEAAASSQDTPAQDTSAPQDTAVAPEEVEPTAAEPAPVVPQVSDLERAQMTMGQLLEVGRALQAWVRDTRLERGRRAPGGRAPAERRWDRCPAIERSELGEILVPAYLRELPEEDAWDRPLQFCLDRRLAAAHQQYGVRSAGSDGVFSGDAYEVGGFPDSRLEGDLVWMDGTFVRWAEPQ